MKWRVCATAAASFAIHVSSEVLRGSSSERKFADADFQYNIPREVKVSFWTDFIPNPAEWRALHAGPNCKVEDTVKQFPPGFGIVPTPDHDVSDADVVVINLSELERHYSLPRLKHKGQLWVATCWEPKRFGDGGLEGGTDVAGDCSLLDDPETMSWFDGVASYDNSSAFPAFFTPPPEQILRRPAPDFSSRSSELAAFSTKDCRWSWRNSFVQEVNASLIAHGFPNPILSFGDCLHTSPEAECAGEEAVHLADSEYDSELFDQQLFWYANRCMSRPFHLVAENTNASWYVTEKVWNALATGAIPVYVGTGDVRSLVPPGSTLFASDFPSAQALVDHMVSVYKEGGGEARLWKTRPVSEWGGWQHARRYSRSTLVARLCEAAAARPALEKTVAPQERSLQLIDAGGWHEAGVRVNPDPTMNPARKQKGVGRSGAVRRAIQGMAAVGDAGARKLLDEAWEEKKRTGRWPDLALASVLSQVLVDTPGWLNGGGHGCESYEAMGWCANGSFADGFEWTGAPGLHAGLCAGAADCAEKFNRPSDNCVVCGKKVSAAAAPQLRAVHRVSMPPTNLDALIQRRSS